MAKLIYYPIGNADCGLLSTDGGKYFIFDFADMRTEDEGDKRIDLAESVKADIGWPKRRNVDVLAVTHGDNDHIQGISDTFWLQHAEKYQGDDRIKFDMMWVPAALIVEEGSEDETKTIRAEARHRFLNKSGIRVFSRPEHLKDWLESKGKKLDDFRDVITDAGQLVPGFTLDSDAIEFFVHSPFAKRTSDQEFLDRNGDCLVMQATIRSEGKDTRVLLTADAEYEAWTDIVTITRAHKNEARLAWDILTIPHHCSYGAMAKEKGDYKTTPSPEFEWLLNKGTTRSVMICTCDVIPSETTKQPPHVETYRRYKEARDQLDSDLVVTMEHPSKGNPKRTVVDIGANGPTLKKEIASSYVTAVTTRPARMG